MKCAKWREKVQWVTQYSVSPSIASSCVSHEGNAIIYGEQFPSGNSKENMSDVEKKKWRTRVKCEIRRVGGENRELLSAGDWNRIEVPVTRLEAKLAVKGKRPHSTALFYPCLLNPSGISESYRFWTWMFHISQVRFATIILDSCAYFIKCSINSDVSRV